MDVRCDKCGTEYELEDAKVTDAGVTVRCTECGTVFKVKRRTVAVTEPVGSTEINPTADRPWMVRRENGDVYTFRELTTLQKWIVERKVIRSDEISRSGETWKRLGNIAELATFFQVVEQAERAGGSGGPPPISLGAPVGQTPPVAQAVPPPAAAPPAPQPAAAPPAAAAPPPAPAYTPPPAAPPPAAPVAPAPRDEFAWGGGSDDLYGDIDDDDFAEFKRGGAGKWIIIFLILLAGGAGAFYYFRPAQVRALLGLGPKVSDIAKAQAAQGWKDLVPDTKAAYAKAEADFKKAVALAGKTPFAEAEDGVAETDVRWGLALREEAKRDAAKARNDGAAIDAGDGSVKPGSEKPAPDKAAKGKKGEKTAAADEKAKEKAHAEAKALADQANELNDQASKKLDAAFDAAKKAMQADPNALASLRAMAAYYMAEGSSDQLKSLLDKASKKKGAAKDARLAWIRGVSYLGDAASLDSAEQHLQHALELDPGFVRARYDLARAYAAEKEPDKATTQAKKVLQASPDHARAKALLAELAPPKPKPEPKKPEPPKKPEVKKPPKPLGFDGLLSKAHRLREAGKTQAALDVYGRARDLKPGRAEAYAGQGWCYIEMRAYAPAAAAFQDALKRNPEYGDAIIGLAEASKDKGDMKTAKKYYKRYLDILPDGPQAPVARTNLGSP